MKLFISAIFLLLLAPCNSQQKLGSAEDYNKVLIQYAETPCFGECPVYQMELNGATMTATFKGLANTSKIGTYTKPISNTEFARFMEALDRADFNKLDDEYLGRVPDFPIKEITVTKNGKIKKVRDRSEAPPALGELEQIFKNFANTDGWERQENKAN